MSGVGCQASLMPEESRYGRAPIGAQRYSQFNVTATCLKLLALTAVLVGRFNWENGESPM